MKTSFRPALSAILLSACLLPLLLASDGEDDETEPSPLTDYRFVPDRAFDLLSSEEAESSPPPSVATDDPHPEESLPALAGPREAPPRPGEELTFPLTLEIPEIPPDERVPGSAPTDRGGTAPTANDRRNETPPVFPVLKGSAPAVVGVGATLGDNSDIYLDALVPFWQTGTDAYRTILFLAPRITGTEEETNSGSLGLGIRSLRGEGALSGKSFPWIIGANVFYDFTRSSNDFDYNQFGAGIEWMSPLIDLRVNAYFPDRSRNQVAETSSTSSRISTSTTTQTTYGQPFPTGHTVVQPFTVSNTTRFRRTTTTRFFEKYEQALQGFDGEAGLLLPADLTFIPVRVYGGYYSFDNPFGSDITGPKARVEARPFPFLLLDASWYQDEELLGSNWFLGARASVRIGGGPTPPSSSKPLHDTKAGPKKAAYNPYGDFHRRLVERIPRNYRAVLVESPFLEERRPPPVPHLRLFSNLQHHRHRGHRLRHRLRGRLPRGRGRCRHLGGTPGHDPGRGRSGRGPARFHRADMDRLDPGRRRTLSRKRYRDGQCALHLQRGRDRRQGRLVLRRFGTRTRRPGRLPFRNQPRLARLSADTRRVRPRLFDHRWTHRRRFHRGHLCQRGTGNRLRQPDRPSAARESRSSSGAAPPQPGFSPPTGFPTPAGTPSISTSPTPPPATTP